MSFITLDFETYYDKDLGFRTQTNEEYLNDPRFEVIGVGIKVDDGPTKWVTEDIADELAMIDWGNSALLCHNMMFDGAILAWKYSIVPAMYFDTLCMARAIHGVDAGGSLAALAERYNLGKKGTEVVDALGKRKQDFTPEELAAYGRYCANDVELTFKLFNVLLSDYFPQDELDLIDMTLRMYTQPVLMVDDALLVDRLEEIKNEKFALLNGLQAQLGCESAEDVRKKLASNPQFAEVLEKFGIEPPKKISPTTGKETFALAKNDEGFIALQEHEDPFIQQLCAIRLGTKSTIEESRVERFIDIGARNKGLLPIPLKYYGAHTGRWAGQDAVNFQNLPSRDKKKKALKNGIVAPPGHYVINCDSSQIEARVLVWFAGQVVAVAQYRANQDRYSIFASKVYGREITKDNSAERFVGKTCFTADTLVLTNSGYKPIDKITSVDRLWDGIEWVSHGGVVCQGTRTVLEKYGVAATKDHEILTEHGWREWQEVLLESSLFQSARLLANSLSSGTNVLKENDLAGNPSFDVVAGGKDLSPGTILRVGGQPGVTYAQKKQRRLLGGIDTKVFYQTTITEQDCSTGYPLRLTAATTLRTEFLSTMALGVLLSTKNGETTAQPFLDIFKQYLGGTAQNTTWIEPTQTKDMSRGILGSCLDRLTLKIKDAWQIWKQRSGFSKKKTYVYDLINCGPRHRFTVLTSQGPIIASNCVLGLGYGTGAVKLRHTLATAKPINVYLSEDECKRIVNLYRQENHKITELWQECDRALEHLASWPKGTESYPLGKHEAVWVTRQGLRLPNGLYIRYKNLRRGEKGFIYDSRKGPKSIWGGAVVENVVQALARIIVGQQMLAMRKWYRPVLTVHDAAVVVVENAQLPEALAFITETMSTPPSWAAGLPVACEAKYGRSYGDC
jgi:DNA polymerase I-like protein with 3'-5' exonuclease and polymerase domains